MLCFIVDLMARQGWYNSNVEQLVLKSLDRQWDDSLIEVYGRFEAKDANTQLARAEKWLDDFGHNENLLLSLGRIAMRARLWGKAQGYFEASIGARATPAACQALAQLYEQQLQQPDKAAEYYQRGLKLSLDSSG
jgi:HemY protein